MRDTPVVETLTTAITERLAPYADERFLLLDPPPRLIDALVRAVTGETTLPHVDVAASETTLRTVRQQFLLATRVATAVATDRCRLRGTDTDDLSTVFVSPDRLCVVVVVDDAATVREPPSGDWTTAFYAAGQETFANAEPYPLRTPTLEELLSSDDTPLPAAFHDAFETALDIAASFDDPALFDPVRTALVLAARHELLNYDVSRWGERVGVASKATFSRRKGQLEDAHLTTEEVSAGLGRPRQRLLLTDTSRAVLDEGGLAELLRSVHE
jgi:hypothetical protein